MLAFLEKHKDAYPKGLISSWVNENERFLRFFKARFFHDQICRWLIHYQEIYIDKFTDVKLSNRSESISILLGAWHLFLELQKKSRRCEVNGIFATHLQFFQDLLDVHAKYATWIGDLYKCAYKRLSQVQKKTKADEEAQKSLMACSAIVEGCETLPLELNLSRKPNLETSSPVSSIDDAVQSNAHFKAATLKSEQDFDSSLELNSRKAPEKCSSVASIPFFGNVDLIRAVAPASGDSSLPFLLR